METYNKNMTKSSKTIYYSGDKKHLVAVDCIIFGFQNGVLKLLLLKRKVEPLKGQWSLIGSFVKPNESLDDAAKRILKESTGLEDVFMEQLYCFGDVDRDPGDRVISMAYNALMRLEESDEAKVEDFGAKWIPVDQVPSMVIDHDQMMQTALAHLQNKIRFYPIGFELLPEKFTLPQLLQLYQAIYRQPLDDRNFRKKILSLDILKKQDEKDKSVSRKGAFYYRFDKKKYEKLMKRGGGFFLKL
ncbi:MAG: 8-oxo-dGTP diphosphatase [Saprospiraceae bacterium]